MKRLVFVFGALVILASFTVVAGDHPTGSHRATQNDGRQFKIEVDPANGVISGPTEGSANGSFALTNVTCPNCGSPCVPLSRTVVVVLTAQGAVPHGYSVGNLALNHATLDTFNPDRKDPLNPGDAVTYTFTLDPEDCGTTFRIYFDMCQPGDPANPSSPCPVTP
jgi:hypothetical protein